MPKIKRHILWKLFIVTAIIVIAAGLLLFKLYVYKMPESRKILSFNDWYLNLKVDKTESKQAVEYSRSIESPYLLIDTIFRSMEGPMTAKEVFINDQITKIIGSAFLPELLWITGYKVELFDDKNNRLTYDFMCHNNLNIGKNNVLPWKINTLGTDKRLFTLTEGQTEIHLPEHYGIPVMSNQRLRVDFQVLNHNQFPVNVKVKQRVTIYYKRNTEISESMRALYQQSIFVCKQVAGPRGDFNEEPSLNADTLINSQDLLKVCCSNTGLDMKDGYPFLDNYKREFTGHWVLSDSLETTHTDVTRMLNLSTNTLVHFFSVHVHPFCKSLELIDNTTGLCIYKAEMVNFKDKVGLEMIPLKSTSDGILLYSNHNYKLVSIYNKTRPERHTAMASMYLYCEEK